VLYRTTCAFALRVYWMRSREAAPDLGGGPSVVGEPEVAIRPSCDAESRARGDIELGDGPCCSPGGSCTQAQQTDTGDQGGEQCGQVRPPSRTIHAGYSFVDGATLCCLLPCSQIRENGSARPLG